MIHADTDGNHGKKIIRLLLLQSVTAGGLRSAKYDQLKRIISQVYGFEYIFTLQIFERMGLLKKKDTILSVVDTSSSTWHSIKKPLQLINESINMSRPDDISYVTAGYAPISVRLVQALIAPDTVQKFALEIKQLPGPYLDFYQHESSADELGERLSKLSSESTLIHTSANPIGHSGSTSSRGTAANSSVDDPTGSKEGQGKPVMLFVLIGGISLLEIAALRFLSKDPSFPYSVLIASTNVLSEASLIESIHNDDDFAQVPLDREWVTPRF